MSNSTILAHLPMVDSTHPLLKHPLPPFITILGVVFFGTFILSSIPRLVARFLSIGRGAELSKGWTFRRPPPTPVSQKSTPQPVYEPYESPFTPRKWDQLEREPRTPSLTRSSSSWTMGTKVPSTPGPLSGKSSRRWDQDSPTPLSPTLTRSSSSSTMDVKVSTPSPISAKSSRKWEHEYPPPALSRSSSSWTMETKVSTPSPISAKPSRPRLYHQHSSTTLFSPMSSTTLFNLDHLPLESPYELKSPPPRTATTSFSSPTPKSSDFLINLRSPTKPRIPKGKQRITKDPPIHLPSWGEIIPYGANLDLVIPKTGLTVGRLIIVVIWCLLVILACAWSNKPIKDTFGTVAVVQLPIAIALAGKAGPLAFVTGKSYEKLNYLHRWIGRTLFLVSTAHVIYWVHAWTARGDFIQTMRRQPPTGGMVAWGAMLFIAITAMPFIRVHMYTLFLACHWVGIVATIIGLAFHVPSCTLYAVISAAVYLFDIILRLALKTRLTSATFTIIPESTSIMVTVPTISRGWRAGQHVYIRVLGLKSQGGSDWMETHPFTIASCEGEELKLVIKKAGDWTRSLYEWANEAEGSGEGGRDKVGRVMLEGPYGGPGNAMWNAYDSTLLFAGGSGVTFAMGVLQDLVKKASEGGSISTVTLVWVVKNLDQAQAMMSTLQSLPATALTLNLNIFVTRGKPGTDDKIIGGIRVLYRRPNVEEIVRWCLRETSTSNTVGMGMVSRRGGMGVGVCGPAALDLDVRRAIASLTLREKREVGGVELHAETFGW